MVKQMVIGNWKLHGSIGQLKSVLGEVAQARLDANIGVCVPAPYLMLAKQILQHTHVQCGAQDVSQYHIGPYTGEVSSGMLADVGCEMVIIGHSERRRLFGETTEQAGVKLRSALDAGLFGVYCVGESAEERRQGVAEQVVAAQLEVLKGLPIGLFAVAYEPSWAVGSGIVASGEQISPMHALIKDRLEDRVRVLYGGSVKSDNAAQILAVDHVDGVLVGGAALSAFEFLAICQAAR
ncbi:triose-phosphate isomerase [Chitinibacter sp. S2-10]|uniref:triose-phosphate isomerase n=1 Tax=Chitinibacter sp. S2-10 TaxID=3373597 RepID=UPI0039774F39